ncbi:MAG: hypothetical protein GKS05_00380 [Nitrospirales bacterium]|nr:hypothetical protein [Nitrospirales bacterium]
MDLASLQRIKIFMEFIQGAKQTGTKLSFVSTPTEHGDNITATAIIDGKFVNTGILFWDVSLLQEQGFVDTLDEDDLALGMNLTDGMVEDAEQILNFIEAQLRQFEAS